MLPAEIASPLTRLWPPATLIRPLAELLLHADLRPDDRLLVIGSAWPWLAALLERTTVILAAATPATLLAVAAEEGATVLVAPAQVLAEAAFQRARRRPILANLRTIVATGGPLSPEGRTRIYTWIKSDLMLLARTGDTLWGNPLEPVYAHPAASPGFVTPPASAPAPR
jgi:acetoacetyl-CoA synthetase